MSDDLRVSCGNKSFHLRCNVRDCADRTRIFERCGAVFEGEICANKREVDVPAPGWVLLRFVDDNDVREYSLSLCPTCAPARVGAEVAAALARQRHADEDQALFARK